MHTHTHTNNIYMHKHIQKRKEYIRILPRETKEIGNFFLRPEAIR